MSTFDITKSWLEDEDEIEIKPVRRTTKEKMKADSRENSSSRKRSKPNYKNEAESNSKHPKKPVELETNTDILQRRQKQIDYGKNTVGYHNYITEVPRHKRTKEHPKTPDKYTKYSRRSWDMLIKLWRLNLHKFDNNSNNECEVKIEPDDEDLST